MLKKVPKKVLALFKAPKIVPKKVLFPKKVPKKVPKKALEAVGNLYASPRISEKSCPMSKIILNVVAVENSLTVKTT